MEFQFDECVQVLLSSLIGALADGVEVFRRRVCRRVLAERGAEVFVNRCPTCRRVVRTPQARQCLWCGFDWHGSETRNEGRNAFAE
jgi:hypothetical protein